MSLSSFQISNSTYRFILPKPKSTSSLPESVLLIPLIFQFLIVSLSPRRLHRFVLGSTRRTSAWLQWPPQAPKCFAVSQVLGKYQRVITVAPPCPFTGTHGGLVARDPSSFTSISSAIGESPVEMKATATVPLVYSPSSKLIGAAALKLTVSSLSLLLLL